MMKPVPDTPEYLWILFLSGDSKALDAIVKKHYNLLYQYGCKFTRDTALVKDCIQDLFLFLWQKRASINERWSNGSNGSKDAMGDQEAIDDSRRTIHDDHTCS